MAPLAHCVALGDSLTFADSLGFGIANFWPAFMQRNMNATRFNLSIDNLARSGEGTGNMIGVINGLHPRSDNQIGMIFCGSNDSNASNIGTIQASPSPTTTTFTLDTGMGQQFGVGGSVIVGVETPRTVSAISGDAITLSTALSGAPSAGTQVVNNTATNLITMGEKLRLLGYSKLMIFGQQYLNWSSGGDTPAQEQAPSRALRIIQQAAATSLGAAYVDLYNLMRQRILLGYDVQGSFTWHIADMNSHCNPYGESIIAQCAQVSMFKTWLVDLL